VVVELGDLQQLGENGPVVVRELFAGHGRISAMLVLWRGVVLESGGRAGSGAAAQAADDLQGASRQPRRLPSLVKEGLVRVRGDHLRWARWGRSSSLSWTPTQNTPIPQNGHRESRIPTAMARTKASARGAR
jgi:hypothetical protein